MVVELAAGLLEYGLPLSAVQDDFESEGESDHKFQGPLDSGFVLALKVELTSEVVPVAG